MKTLDYLEELKAVAPRPSVYAVAQLLGLKEDTVRSWHLGRAHPDAYACSLIAEALDRPIEQVLADVQADKETDPTRKRYWEGLARKYAACVVAGLATTMWPSDGRSATGQPELSGATEHATVGEGVYLCTNYATQLRRLLMRLLMVALVARKAVARGFGRFPGAFSAS